jgi:hypothetical protein
MNDSEAVVAVIEALRSHEIPYMVVGSYSSNYYGIDRSSQDADFVIELGSASLIRALKDLSGWLRLDPQIAFETVTMSRCLRAKVIDSEFSVEFFLLGDDPYHQERFRRRHPVELRGQEVYLPTREDVVVQKLRWARPKDLEDARDVIAVQGDDAFDWDYIHRWTETHGTRELLDKIRASIPEI